MGRAHAVVGDVALALGRKQAAPAAPAERSRRARAPHRRRRQRDGGRRATTEWTASPTSDAPAPGRATRPSRARPTCTAAGMQRREPSPHDPAPLDCRGLAGLIRCPVARQPEPRTPNPPPPADRRAARPRAAPVKPCTELYGPGIPPSCGTSPSGHHRTGPVCERGRPQNAGVSIPCGRGRVLLRRTWSSGRNRLRRSALTSILRLLLELTDVAGEGVVAAWSSSRFFDRRTADVPSLDIGDLTQLDDDASGPDDEHLVGELLVLRQREARPSPAGCCPCQDERTGALERSSRPVWFCRAGSGRRPSPRRAPSSASAFGGPVAFCRRYAASMRS